MVVNVKKTIFLGHVTMLSGRYTQMFQINLLSAPSGQRHAGSSEMVHMSIYQVILSHIYLPPWFTEDGEEQENH
jgi:hypothetical protein